tara:strand:+ start:6866 stop:8158 length:1293 start_codon:yes stop_codon:yes gene_type:complete
MKKFKKIYIAGINRSGGSLLARLFDNHSKILSYPIELGFPRDLSYFDIVEDYSGVPQSVPIYNPPTDIDIFDLLELPKKKPSYETTWGKEHADPLGVRKNYLEKVFYGNIKTDFDYDLFKEIVSYESKKASNIVDLYNIRHYAYFKSWDNAKYLKNQSHIVMHDSGGLYLTNIDYYFDSFKDSTLIYPLRDIYGYIAAEKTRFARRYFGSRRFAWPQCPNLFVKKFTSYEIGAQIKCWLTSLTRVRLLQEKYDSNARFIVYRHDQLTKNPSYVMKNIINRIGLEFEDTLLNPTIAGQNWLGNSHYGPLKGISNDISKNYKKVLRQDEFNEIDKHTSKISNILEKETPLNLLSIPEKLFYEYKNQKKYFNDKEKITLYYALSNSMKRRQIISQPKYYALIAIIFRNIVRFLHIPRILKLKYFKGKGKQNYT